MHTGTRKKKVDQHLGKDEGLAYAYEWIGLQQHKMQEEEKKKRKIKKKIKRLTKCRKKKPQIQQTIKSEYFSLFFIILKGTIWPRLLENFSAKS
jgi:hypothetical protein